MFDVVDGALEIGVSWLSMYAFSTENWRRPADEVRFLMNFNEGILSRHRDELHEKGVRIRFAGRRDWRVPKRLLRHMDEAVELTSNRKMTLTICFNYGGRAEIVDAVRQIVADGVTDQGRRAGDRLPALLSRHARPRPRDPDLRRVPDLELLALGARLLRARLHRRALAGLPPRGPLRRGREFQRRESALRRGDR
jgi:undecaprenyl pyrophosphate synthase